MSACRNHPHAAADQHCAICALDLCADCVVRVRAVPFCASCKAAALADPEAGMQACREAGEALWTAVAGLFCFGIVLGPAAIKKALAARSAIALDPRLTGWGKAQAGLVLGVIDLAGWALVMVQRAAGG